MEAFWAQFGALLLPLLIGTFVGTLLRPVAPRGRAVQLLYLVGALVVLFLFVTPVEGMPGAVTFLGRTAAGVLFGLYSPPWRHVKRGKEQGGEPVTDGEERTPDERE